MSSNFSNKKTWVDEYYKKDGTHVDGHWRYFDDNSSFDSNSLLSGGVVETANNEKIPNLKKNLNGKNCLRISILFYQKFTIILMINLNWMKTGKY